MKNILKKNVVESIRRCLGLMDRNSLSSTYGCMDREFWKYKTIREFPSATYQTPMKALALVYANDFEGNPFAGDKEILEYALAALSFWAEIQHSDGSFDEWYLNEHSYCATAFTCLAASQTYEKLVDYLDTKTRAKVENALSLSGAWLAKRHNPWVMNQNIAALVALSILSRIFSERSFEVAARKMKQIILSGQQSEGWFLEYNGADIGYCFVCIDLLSMYLDDFEDPEIEKALVKLFTFTNNFVHPDGTAGGFYGSRGTQYLMIQGLFKWAGKNDKAAQMLNKISHGLKVGTTISPAIIDDKYCSYFYVNSWAEAWISLKTAKAATLFNENTVGCVFFPESGLFAHSGKKYSAFGNLKKNGAVTVIQNSKRVFVHAGYQACSEDGQFMTSNVFLKEANCANIENSKEGTAYVTKGYFCKNKGKLPLIRYILPFKLACRTVLKWPMLAERFSKIVKKSEYLKDDLLPIAIERMLCFKEKEIIVRDKIRCLSNIRFKIFSPVIDSILPESPASNIFVSGGPEMTICSSAEVCNQLNRAGQVEIEMRVVFSENAFVIRITLKDVLCSN